MGLRYNQLPFLNLPLSVSPSPYIAHFSACKKQMNCILTILSGLDIEDIAADPISSLRVGQHLNTVVCELLEPSQLHLFTCGGDVLHLSPF